MSPASRVPPTGTRAGVLRPDQAAQFFRTVRLPAGPDVDTWVEGYWSVSWDLPPGTRYLSRVVSHPALHATFESGRGRRHGVELPAALVFGVVTTAFEIELAGAGRAFGVRFRPGGFGAFTGTDVAALTDVNAPLADVVGAPVPLDAVLAAGTDEERRAVVEPWLATLAPATDPTYERLLTVVRRMLADRTLTSVDQVVVECDVPLRTLQRLFRRYVGVGPKWVLRRFRLHDAVTRLDEDPDVDLGALAAELGWYDQPHLTRDFTEVVGVPPKTYATRGRSPSAATG